MTGWWDLKSIDDMLVDSMPCTPAEERITHVVVFIGGLVERRSLHTMRAGGRVVLHHPTYTVRTDKLPLRNPSLRSAVLTRRHLWWPPQSSPLSVGTAVERQDH